MDFSLSEEQELLQQTLAHFVERECPTPRVRELFEAGEGGDPALWKGLADLGLAGLVIPERHGGAGLELLECALVAEALGYGAVPVPFLEHTLTGLALATGGDEAQQQRWLPGLASGELRGTIALAEAGAGWEPGDWTLPLADGRVHGTKRLAPSGPAADLLVVGCAAGELAVVDAHAPELQWEPTDTLDRGRPLFGLRLDAAAAVPLAPGTAERLRDAALVLLAADAFGAGYRLVRMATAYAQGREQFGQPIAGFQAVKHQLANMALEVDPTRGLFWYAAHAFDHLPAQRERAAALAKAHITDRVMQVARDAIEIHGGMGMTWECDAQIWFKRALFDRQWMGTPELHRTRLAALGGW